jgi:hypothetical protein
MFGGKDGGRTKINLSDVIVCAEPTALNGLVVAVRIDGINSILTT